MLKTETISIKNTDFDMDLITIDKFIENVDSDTVTKLERYMGNNENIIEEYIMMDQDYSFLDSNDIDKRKIVDLSNLLNISEHIQNDGREEVSIGHISIPNDNDYRCVVVNTKSDSYVIVSIDDCESVIKGILETRLSDVQRIKSIKPIKEEIEKLEEGLEDIDLNEVEIEFNLER